ncbi:unnamed protein product, partial [Phaeothamnion confervicola]
MAAAMEQVMAAALARRRKAGSLRELPCNEDSGQGSASAFDSTEARRHFEDFSSNDYLGLARCPKLLEAATAEARCWQDADGRRLIGSTGSRLISGDSAQAREFEAFLRGFHNRDAALLFASGYDANVGLLSSVPRPGDAVFLDELVHNSVVMGSRLGRQAKVFCFRHNDHGRVGSALIAVESIYSMDGDAAPLAALLTAAATAGAAVVVDEAHATGVLGAGGRGLLSALGLERHPALLASVHTFGKALGAHGAAVLGSATLRTYLCNYAWPLVYSTAPPPHALAAARCAYRRAAGADGEKRRRRVLALSRLNVRAPAEAAGFGLAAVTAPPLPPHALVHGGGDSPIVAVLLPGNARVVHVAAALRGHGLDVRPIRAPTVPAGTERLRVCLHAHNSRRAVLSLAHHIR